MNIQRFAARTSHEAIARVRHAFGDDAIVLHSQPCAEGVELVAMSSRDLSTLQRQGGSAPRHDFVAPTPSSTPAPRLEAPATRDAERAASAAAPASATARADVRGDADLLSMTTLSFQDYVRQRMRQRRRDGAESPAAAHVQEQASASDARVEPIVESVMAPVMEPVVVPITVPQPRAARPLPPQAVTPTMPQPVTPTMPQPVAERPVVVDAAAVEVSSAPAPAEAAAPIEAPVAPPAAAAKAARAPAPVDVARMRRNVEAKPAPSEWAVLPLEPRAVPPIEPLIEPLVAAMPDPFAARVASAVAKAVTEAPAAPATPAAVVEAGASIHQDALLRELRDVKSLIESRVGTLALTESLRDPRRSQLAQRLVDAGFSPVVVRSLATRLPEGVSDETSWVELELERLLVTAPQGVGLEDAKGVVAFVGPAGCGKTGCMVKVATAFVARHGASQLGLITLDGQRAGGHESLRAEARAMGVAVHVAHDRASLNGLLQLLASKRLLLIDTPAVSPRDAAAVNELLATLGDGAIRRMLVVAATSQGESIDDAVQAFNSPGAGERGSLQGALLSKVDEATRLGPALDVLVRRRLRLWGVAQGPGSTADWHRADARSLLHRALRAHQPAAWRADASQVLLLLDSAPASS